LKNLCRRFLNWFIYSEEQKEFLKDDKCKFDLNSSNKIIAIQVQNELDFLKRFIFFSKKYSYSSIGINLDKPHYNIFDLVVTPLYFIKVIEQFFLRKKQYSFHRKFNLFSFSSPKSSFFSTIKYLPKAFNLFFSLKEKKDILNIKHDDILIGDLIYDTYLRYFKKKTVNLKDLSLILLFARTYSEIFFLEKISKSINIFLTGYTTYTNNGLPVRIFIKNGVEVFSFSNSISGKKLNINDFTHTKSYWNYKRDFSTFNYKEQKIKAGLDLIKNRLNGENDLKYMRFNTYTKSYQSETRKYDGIIFLHDFTDSNHVYRWSLFEDFYEWIIFTLNLVDMYNLNIGIKPHPNQNITSKKIVEKLKKEYYHLSWIDERTSNSELLTSSLKFGISIHGTILSELAFSKIIPICCGDNPTINYGFTFNAKTKYQYKDFIINHDKLLLKEDISNKIGEFVYMNHIN
jgi:hypothetical protein